MEFQNNSFIRTALILDNYIKDIHEAHFEAAVSIAASYIESMSQQNETLDLMLVGDQLHSEQDQGGDIAMLESLACIEGNFESTLDKSQLLLDPYIEQLSSCVCILLSWDKHSQQLLKYLEMHTINYHCFIITDADNTATTPPNCHYLRHNQLEHDLQQAKP